MRHLMIYDMIEAVHRSGSIRKAAEELNGAQYGTTTSAKVEG